MRICDHHSVPRNWDQHFADPNYGDAPPDPLLIQVAELLPPGRALDLACGAGRHTLYLARLGWSVDAVDSSPAGIRRVRAQSAGLRVDAHLADLERGEFTISPDSYDLIADFLYLQRSLFPTIREGVRPGGVFAGSILLQDGPSDIPPPKSDFLLRAGELRSFFDGWKVIFYSEGSGTGNSHRTAGIIARRA